jgi:hypothetical protein
MSHPLAKKIAELEHRLVMRRRVAAACSTLATVLAAALVLGWTDYLVRYNDRGLRVMASAALATVASWAVYRWWYVPSRRRLGLLEVARQVEARFPELRDSLASAMEFLDESEDDATAGSALLRRAVINEADATIDGLPLGDVVDRRPLRRAAGWATGAVSLVVVCLALDAAAVGTAVVRLAAPLGATTWPRQHHLAFRDPPSRLAAGSTFEVELIDTAGPLPEEVRIEYRSANAGVTFEWMTRVGDLMVARRENVRRSFSFRAEGGDDRAMPWAAVEVVEPPQVESLSIVTHPPAYTGLPSAPAQQQRLLDVLTGTGIELTGTASRPLRAARVVVGDQTIDADIGPDAAGRERRGFHVAPDKWIAAASGTYRLELEGDDGLAGTAGQGNLRVEPDSPPSVSWQRPTGDLYVTAGAVVSLAAVVKDNLAIQAVSLIYQRSDKPDVDQPPIELYRSGHLPKGEGILGDVRSVEYDWPLEPLALRPGTQLTMRIEANDYRPGTGRTVAPRRITVITADELDARLADRQSQIVRQLERALEVQRTARGGVRRVEIQQKEAHSLASGDRDVLQTAELNQRRVRRMLVDEAEGVPALAAALVDELAINGVERSDAVEQMGNLTAALARLAAGPLPMAERELTAARKSADAAADPHPNPLSEGEGTQAEMLLASLATAGAAQDDVIAAVEGLLDELAPWTDYRRFARQLVQLCKDQIAHEQAARSDVGTDTLTLELRELSTAQRANLMSASAGQDALARRFDDIAQAMRDWTGRLSAQSGKPDDLSSHATPVDAVGDALEVAQRRAIGSNMKDAARELSENRVGQALEREQRTVADLQEMISALEGQPEQKLERLVDKLLQAERDLAALRNELAALRQQIAQATAGLPASQTQHELRARIEQLTRQLQRLQADAAAGSTRRAAERLAGERASARGKVEQAEQDLAEAAQQLAERRGQAEFDLQREFINRFLAALGPMVDRQRGVVDKTKELDAAREPRAPLTATQLQAVDQLAQTERALADETREHRELLFGLGAVRLSLGRAADRLAATGVLLAQHDTGPVAQQAGQEALERLEKIADALRQTADEAAGEPGGAGAGAGPGGDQQRRQPAFDLLEVKLLRMLQAELNERTRDYQQRLSEAGAAAADQGAFQREAAELAAEQGRLAELVREILARNNGREER